MTELHLGRWLVTGDEIVDGYLRVIGDTLAETCLGRAPSDSSKAVIIPGLVNAHTHIGDSIAYPAPRGSVKEIVGPPDGYKHRVLGSSDRKSRIEAMKASLELMSLTGTEVFADFREGGIEGLRDLYDASDRDTPMAIVLGRPTSSDSDMKEIGEILNACNGIGMSAFRDWPHDFIRKISGAARAMKKVFALHASEDSREDIGPILDLRPSFLVHMASALDSDLRQCAREAVPIVVCPRSNEFFGLNPDIPRMMKAGVEVGLGTDNCMVSRPDMIEEIKAAYRLSKSKGGITPLDAVHLATFGGRKVLNATGNIASETEIADSLVVVGIRGDDPLRSLVTMGKSEDIQAVVRGGRVWRRPESWTR